MPRSSGLQRRGLEADLGEALLRFQVGFAERRRGQGGRVVAGAVLRRRVEGVVGIVRVHADQPRRAGLLDTRAYRFAAPAAVVQLRRQAGGVGDAPPAARRGRRARRCRRCHGPSGSAARGSTGRYGSRRRRALPRAPRRVTGAACTAGLSIGGAPRCRRCSRCRRRSRPVPNRCSGECEGSKVGYERVNLGRRVVFVGCRASDRVPRGLPRAITQSEWD